MTVVIALALVSVASMTIRLAPIVAADRWRLSETAQQALRHAGVGALAALTVMEATSLLGLTW
jgi:branched-subunit amino acid transport protein